MTHASKQAIALWALTACVALATPAMAQVTDAQRSAIRSACRSDYIAHCSSVTPGGAEAVQCLQKNMASLSPACASAVRAVETAAAPKTEPAAAAPKTGSAPAEAAKTESTKTEPAKTETAPAPAKTETAAPKPEPAPGAAVAKPTAGTVKPAPAAKSAAAPAAGAPAAAAAPSAAPAKPLVLRPMLPREELFVLRSACGADVRTLCGGVAPGGGRIIQCLAVRAGSLSPACKDVLAQFAAQ